MMRVRRLRMGLLLLLSLLLPLLLHALEASALMEDDSYFPSELRLAAGVLHSPPMAIVEELESGQTSFSGLQIELLERLKVFAAEDGVNLQFNLSQSPPLYGDAFDLLAKDCNTTNNPNPLKECQRYDIIIGDYYSNANRFRRADLSPPWMKTSMATIKHVQKDHGRPEIITLTQAQEAKASVCVPRGTYLSTVVRQKFPGQHYTPCDPFTAECIHLIKSGTCVLYVEDELALQYQTFNDDSLELTGESFNNQFLVWPMRHDLPTPTSRLVKRWMYRAVENATLDQLYIDYFTKGQCPLGTAGASCELLCDPEHGAANSTGSCVCKSAKWTGEDCSVEVMEDLNLIPSGLINLAYGLAGINFTLVALCAMWLFRNRHRSHIQMAQPMFLCMVLVGCVISTSSIFAMAQQHEGDGPVHLCAAIPWLYSIGFSLTFGAMFARIRRIYLVLQYAIELKRVTVSARETLLTATIVLAMDVLILTVWTIVDPLRWKRTITTTDIFGDPLESEGYCTSEHWRIFAGLIASIHFSLMAVACYMCYLARKIPERVSNGKYVTIAMFSNFQIFLVLIPVLIMLGSSNPQASFLVKAAAIWINDFVVVSLIFGDIIYKIHQHDLEAAFAVRLSRTSSHHRIKSDLRRYAKAMRGFSSRIGMGIGFSTHAAGQNEKSVPAIAVDVSSDEEGSSLEKEEVIHFSKDCEPESSRCGDESTLFPSMFHDESTFLGSTVHESGNSVRTPFGELPGVDEAKCEDTCDGDLVCKTHVSSVHPEPVEVVSSIREVDSLSSDNKQSPDVGLEAAPHPEAHWKIHQPEPPQTDPRANAPLPPPAPEWKFVDHESDLRVNTPPPFSASGGQSISDGLDVEAAQTESRQSERVEDPAVHHAPDCPTCSSNTS